MHIFHKWKNIYQKRTNGFLGEKIESLGSTQFRICDVCYKCQGSNDEDSLFANFTLDPERSEILVRKIKLIEGVWILENSAKEGVKNEQYEKD
jgi:hypothetical protein